MLTLTDITDLKPIFDYQTGFSAPYFFPTDFESWRESFEEDIDGEGRRLFAELRGKAAWEGERLVGFIRFGTTAFGFDGEPYQVIRELYFDRDREDAGRLLLREALAGFDPARRVYAFFHYFGMSCFARHGKLFEAFPWIGELLHSHGFVTEHENVYYSAALTEAADPGVTLVPHDPTPGRQQTIDFLLDRTQIGGCEVHALDTPGNAYLRWIYIHDDHQNSGLGSRCMTALKLWLRRRGLTRLDTDTALDNRRAQHFYEKNGFTRMGVTRSFYRGPILGTTVTVIVDRPLGTFHPSHGDIYYSVNYGFIPGVPAPDGEAQDAYILGVSEPVAEFTGRVIAIIHRFDDVEEKWVVAPEGVSLTKEEIMSRVAFQERYFQTDIQMGTHP